MRGYILRMKEYILRMKGYILRIKEYLLRMKGYILRMKEYILKRYWERILKGNIGFLETDVWFLIDNIGTIIPSRAEYKHVSKLSGYRKNTI